MPLFTRRRLQAMFNDLKSSLSTVKTNDLLRRLNGTDTQNAMAAEIELGVVWAIGQVADLVVEPEFPGKNSRPDALSPNLLRGGSSIVEVVALHDDTFSDQDAMNRAADKISHFIGRHRKRATAHLYFEFAEKRYFEARRFRRLRCVKRSFELTPDLEARLLDWLTKNRETALPPIRLSDEQIDVTISWRDCVHPTLRVFSSMPAIAYDLEDNPIFSALRAKRDQLASAPDHLLKCVVLGDAGCRMLRDFHAIGKSPEQISGAQVVRHFLQKPTNNIDVVYVLSQSRNNSIYPLHPSPMWRGRIYGRRSHGLGEDPEHPKLKSLASVLPSPSFEGYQARSLHAQKALRPQARGWYLGTTITINKSENTMSIKLSARLVQELLAGRITTDQFHNFAFGKGDLNQFDVQLKRGLTIQNARIEKAGLDEDDDRMVFELELDPAAVPLKLP